MKDFINQTITVIYNAFILLYKPLCSKNFWIKKNFIKKKNYICDPTDGPEKQTRVTRLCENTFYLKTTF